MKIAILSGNPAHREPLRRLVAGLEGCEVAGLASDGAEAIALWREAHPDLLLVELRAPAAAAAAEIRRIVASQPCAILALTVGAAPHVDLVYEVMGEGVHDAVHLPSLAPGDARALLDKISRVGPRIAPPPTETPGVPRLLAIGASTGGPQAIADVLAHLPGDLPAAVVLIQHVESAFCEGLAAWLSSGSRIPVSVAKDGDLLRPGHAFLARSDLHLTLTPGGRLRYQREPASYPYRPSVDVFFKSALSAPRASAAALLTGMGSDGADGLLALRRAGWLTVAQDEASSVVYGMPRAAARLGAAHHILPLPQIGPFLLQRLCSPVILW